MEPYQQRVVTERDELQERAHKLSQFIGLGATFDTLSLAEQELLREQCEIMWEYFEVLEKRIALFPL